MKKLHKLACLTLVGLGLSAVSSFGQITLYNFSYTFGDGNTVSGQMDGTPAGGGLVDISSVLSLYFNGVQDDFNSPISAYSIATSYGGPAFSTPGVASANADDNNFALIDSKGLILFAMLPSSDTIDYPSGALAIDIAFDFDTPTIPGNWTFVDPPSPVPEPSTIIAGVFLLVPLGLSTVRVLRRHKQALSLVK